MCCHGTYKWVNVINPNQNSQRVKVDACIAEEIQQLNVLGIATLGCCCGHGDAGRIVEWENDYGKWKSHESPPTALIDKDSIEKCRELGYTPFPYFYADGQHNNTWQMILKTGCITQEDCLHWHEEKNLPYVSGLGIIEDRGDLAPLSL